MATVLQTTFKYAYVYLTAVTSITFHFDRQTNLLSGIDPRAGDPV
jgi:hypothetical protein